MNGNGKTISFEEFKKMRENKELEDKAKASKGAAPAPSAGAAIEKKPPGPVFIRRATSPTTRLTLLCRSTFTDTSPRVQLVYAADGMV